MSTTTPSFHGLRTVIFPTSDLAASRDWFVRAFGVEPYFDQPFYVGFSIGGYELGIHPDEGEHPVTYWGADDVGEALAHLESVGAARVTGPNEVGDGIVTGTVRTPDGYLMGVIHNPHFAQSQRDA